MPKSTRDNKARYSSPEEASRVDARKARVVERISLNF